MYPARVAHNSVEALAAHHGAHRPATYWLLVAGIVSIFVALPLVHMDVSIGAHGIVRPVAERVALRAPVGGEIKTISVQNNAAVKRGDPILVIESRVLGEKISLNRQQQLDLTAQLSDLRILIDAMAKLSTPGSGSIAGAQLLEETAKVTTSSFQDAAYLRQWDYFLSQLQTKVLQEERARQEKQRAVALHKRGLLSVHDFEQTVYAAESALLERHLLLRQNLSRWQADRLEKEMRLRDLAADARLLTRQEELYTVRAPADGTLLEFTGLGVGSFVSDGMKIAEITPDGKLVVDAYVAPKDVGFMRVGQQARMMVDAFPYMQWGTLSGTVRSVSEDLIQVANQTMFKATIELDATELKSRTGTHVRIGKGMGVNARFIVANRSLFALLRDRVSEWLDPTVS